MTQEEVVEKIAENIALNSIEERLTENLKENRDGTLLWIKQSLDMWLTNLILELGGSFGCYDMQELAESILCKLEEKFCE